MIREALRHQPISPMAYAVDADHLHIYLQTAKNDVQAVELVIGDPFDWKEVDGKFLWSGKSFPHRPMKVAYTTELFDYYFLEVEAVNRRSKYVFLLHSGEEIYCYGTQGAHLVDSVDSPAVYNLSHAFNYPYINEEDLIQAPAWAKDTVWYLIFPERFAKSAGRKGDFLPWGSVEQGITNHMFFGGDLKGIIEKVPYLANLGITGIYFTPLFKAGSAHKYDTEDYFQIDPSFGTNEDFRTMVQTCHASGIKVMLDGVFNHCGWFHPFFQDCVKNGKKSPYWDCFFIQEENFVDFPLDAKGRPAVNVGHPKYRTFALTPHMPKLNTANPLMEKYLLDVGSYWIREYDIDGWRLDVSNEVGHAFWRKFRQTVRAVKPDVYIMGENWDDSNPWLGGDQFDAVMNYSLSYSIWQFFGPENTPDPTDAKRFRDDISTLLVTYPKNVAENMFNLIDSHDTMRILTRCGNDPERVKLAYLFLFSFGGSPAVCYGDEIGLAGGTDPDSRRCMIWDPKRQNPDLFAFFHRLISLRKEREEMQGVDLVWHRAENGMIVYEKEGLFFLLNNHPASQTTPLPEGLQAKTLKDVWTGETFAAGHDLNLPAFGFRLLEVSE